MQPLSTKTARKGDLRIFRALTKRGFFGVAVFFAVWRLSFRDWGVYAALALALLFLLGAVNYYGKLRGQRALRESEERYRRLFDGVPVALYRFAADGRILDLNLAAIRMFGCESREEALRLDARDLWLDPDEYAVMQRALSETPELEVELLLKRRDGSVIWARNKCRAVFDERGDTLYLEGSIEDATERRIKDAEVEAHQAELQRLLRESDNSRRALQSALDDQRKAEEAARARLAEMEAIDHISSALRAAQTLDEMLPILLDETLSALQSENGAIYLAQPETGELRAAATRGFFNGVADFTFQPGFSITGKVFSSGEIRVSREYLSDPDLDAGFFSGVPSGWGGVCVPIRTAEETAGVIHASVALPREITHEQIKLLVALAEMAGTALHRLRLHEATRRQVQYLQALRLVDQAITTSFDSQVTMNVLLDQITAKLQTDAAGILLLKSRSVLEYAADCGFRTELYRQTRLTMGEDLAGAAADERDLMKSFDLQNDPRFKRVALAKEEGFQSYVSVPLIAKGEIKGVLEIFHRKPLAPSAEWLGFLEALAGQAAIALDNFHLFEGLQRSNIELRQAYEATIEGWSRALDLRDRETEGHTKRVTDLTLKLARKMGVHESEIVHIRRGALLHDIGKMGIPDSILHKPDKLTPEEWDVMRRHASYAYEMLNPIEYLRPALHIPYCHHEKWDGSGYPRGLKGEEIPLVARIFAVVDVWDALTSDRPYRKGWEREKALEYIRSEADKHFDPKVVEAFLGLIAKS